MDVGHVPRQQGNHIVFLARQLGQVQITNRLSSGGLTYCRNDLRGVTNYIAWNCQANAHGGYCVMNNAWNIGELHRLGDAEAWWNDTAFLQARSQLTRAARKASRRWAGSAAHGECGNEVLRAFTSMILANSLLYNMRVWLSSRKCECGAEFQVSEELLDACHVCGAGKTSWLLRPLFH